VRRRTALALASLALPAALATGAHASSPTVRSGASGRIGTLIPADPGAALPRRDATTTSLNWAGWVVRPGLQITGVQSTFTVPKAKATPPGLSVSWAGIGGYGTQDLIQAGTASNSVAGFGGPRYYAWVEMLPAAEGRLINCSGDRQCSVSPGNRMSVDIHLVGTNLWSVSVVNIGRWSWHNNYGYRSCSCSAEWIFEAPSLGVAGVGVVSTVPDVGAAYFGTISNYTTGGHRHTIASGHPVRVNMGALGVSPEAITSNLAPNNQSFRVCTYALRCAAPAR
jgi:hypothetical protein